MNDYEINDFTQVLLPISSKKTRVIENGNEYIVSKNSFNLIKNSCRFFGSSYEGRKEGTKNILGISYKVPVVIEESKNIIFFPTNSPTQRKCIWINLGQISDYYSLKQNSSIIEFKNGDNIEVNISFRSLRNQIFKASRLQYVLAERVKRGY